MLIPVQLSHGFPAHYLLVLTIWFGGLVMPWSAFCSSAVIPDHQEPAVDESTGASEWAPDVWQFIKGEEAPSVLYFGMWSRHVFNNKEEYRTNHELLGGCYKGFFFGTFKNSHHNRGWGGGLQRDVHRGSVRNATWRFGYRAGIVYGYEELSLFDTKLFPLFQTYADLSYKQGGVELSWAGSTVLLGFFWRI